MKLAQIVHNPTSGDGNHTKEELVRYVEKEGLEIRYVSTDVEGWEDFWQNDPDVVFVAGGDGTVHKLAAVLLEIAESNSKVPIHLLPLGTANNIAVTLEVPQDIQKHGVKGGKNTKPFDCGRIMGLDDEKFFLESVGIGIFPALISEMKENKIEAENPSEKLQRTLKVLLEIIRNFEAVEAEIVADGITITGSFLMVELMNIQYIGPNLKLAPAADPGDGYFDLVCIPEESRSGLQEFLLQMIDGQKPPSEIKNFSKTIRARKVKFNPYRAPLHVDDELIQGDSAQPFTATIAPAELQFLKVGCEK